IFLFNPLSTTEIYTLSLHDALPISSVFGTDGAVLHQYLPDRRRYCPLLPSTIHEIAAGGAKARYAESRLALRVELRLPPGWAAWRCRRPRTALILPATHLCLPLQIRFTNSSRLVKRYSTPTRDHSNQHR